MKQPSQLETTPEEAEAEVPAPNPLECFVFQQQFREVGLAMLDENQKCRLTPHDDTLQISETSWNYFLLGEVFSYLEEVRDVKKFLLKSHQNPLLIKQLQHLTFPNLINLNLSGNNIESVQCLARISMPKLKILDLCNNCITSLKAIRRINSGALTTLAFSMNHVMDNYFLVELDAKLLVNTTIEESVSQFNAAANKNKFIQNVTWYFKLQSTYPRILISLHSIKNKNILCKMKEKIMT